MQALRSATVSVCHCGGASTSRFSLIPATHTFTLHVGTDLAEDVGKTDQYSVPDQSFDPNNLLHRQMLYRRSEKHPGTVFYVLVCRTMLGHPARTQDALQYNGRNYSVANRVPPTAANGPIDMDTGRKIFPKTCTPPSP